MVGCGSIGRRHVANLLRRRDVTRVLVFSRRRNGLAGLNLEGGRVRRVKSLGDAEADFAMICNETGRHVEAAMTLAKRGVPLFIEKPLSHKSKEIGRLRASVRRRKVPVFVAYNLRFLGALRRLKKLIDGGTLGKLCCARIEAGQFLPDWRPGRDWRLSYSAHHSRGGGVALDLSHEIDYMRWLFGEPVFWRVDKSRAGNLPLRAEDLFEGIYRFKRGFLCSVHLDYLQKPPRRLIRVIGTRGSVEVDLFGRRFVKIVNGRESVLKAPSLFEVQGTYAAELGHFIRELKSGKRLIPGLDDGARVLELINV